MEAPDRIWIDPLIDLPKLNGHINNDSVEYIRTDAFIKKASFWLECNLSDRPVADRRFWVEDFVNHMKGE